MAEQGGGFGYDGSDVFGLGGGDPAIPGSAEAAAGWSAGWSAAEQIAELQGQIAALSDAHGGQEDEHMAAHEAASAAAALQAQFPQLADPEVAQAVMHRAEQRAVQLGFPVTQARSPEFFLAVARMDFAPVWEEQALARQIVAVRGGGDPDARRMWGT